MKYTSVCIILFSTYLSVSLHTPTFLQISQNYSLQNNAISSISEDLKSTDKNIDSVSNIFNIIWKSLKHLVPSIRQELIDSTFKDEDQADDVYDRIYDCITSDEDDKYINRLLKQFIVKCLESNSEHISRELIEDVMNYMISQGKDCITYEELEQMKEIYELVKTVDEQTRVLENTDRVPVVFLNANSTMQDEDEDTEEHIDKIKSITELQDKVAEELKPRCENAVDLKYGLEDSYETVRDIIQYIF